MYLIIWLQNNEASNDRNKKSKGQIHNDFGDNVNLLSMFKIKKIHYIAKEGKKKLVRI